MSPFDEEIDRIGTHCMKWDGLQDLYGLDPQDALSMWVADMDFRPPAVVQEALQAMLDHGVYGYYGDPSGYLEAIRWWMAQRHGWEVPAEAILTTNGLVNGTAVCVQSFSEPGDGVVLFTPVYHAFARIIAAAGRRVVECPMPVENGQYGVDFDAWDAAMTGSERLAILCSPNNPGGRVWTRDELQGFADFARRHELILVSDEIHHDLVMPGERHVPMARVDPAIRDRLVMMTATTKTFNIAGGHVGNLIVEDAALRARIKTCLLGLGISPNAFGMRMAEAAYSPEGADWVDALCAYLDGNRKAFDAAIETLPGVASMPLQATYLAWVDFSGTGMTQEEITRRVEGEARIATNHGPSFGTGGEGWLRFNLATPRARVEEAGRRLQQAFADLQ